MQYLSTTEQLALTLHRAARRVASEAAEGVISTAIAVLILAFVGAGMYVGFNALMGEACVSVAGELESTVGGNLDCQ